MKNKQVPLARGRPAVIANYITRDFAGGGARRKRDVGKLLDQKSDRSISEASFAD